VRVRHAPRCAPCETLAVLAPAYRPRHPTETVLYAVVRDHLETFLAHARETYAAPLPRYVEDELRSYLRCGVFAHGFVRCHCDACGHDLLVAFSCKGRAACPSCAGRRMSDAAAHLVDRVLPAVPVRQWVLSLPFELRGLAAFRADALSALNRLFVEEVSRRMSLERRTRGSPTRRRERSRMSSASARASTSTCTST
jgi:Transposase zinc-binding domain